MCVCVVVCVHLQKCIDFASIMLRLDVRVCIHVCVYVSM